jgi:hypothetical protein
MFIKFPKWTSTYQWKTLWMTTSSHCYITLYLTTENTQTKTKKKKKKITVIIKA